MIESVVLLAAYVAEHLDLGYAVTSYRAQGELLFSYEPSIPQWLYPLIRSVPIVSPGAIPKKELPEGWLYASVTSWK